MDFFSFNPVGVATLTKGYRCIDTPFENGSFQRRYKGNKPREWSLRFKNKTDDMTAIRDFFDSHNSSSTWKFLWLDPFTDKVVVVCFSDPSSLSWSLNASNVEEIEIVLKEVI